MTARLLWLQYSRRSSSDKNKKILYGLHFGATLGQELYHAGGQNIIKSAKVRSSVITGLVLFCQLLAIGCACLARSNRDYRFRTPISR